ncbi:3-oxoacyl-[acyl-carrier-protein] synthase, KASII [hydrothermal vent metagenome]|uniref:3-oxoacyl-[acyl-carrier-protein] synthase, KASII n=1 Tax=hydrothermal vent metagenome TaxID=652676 RepID=A0A3B1DKA0_9ZZZZ
MSKVFVTGMGVISCVGNNLDSFWGNLCAGKCGIRQLQSLDTSALPVTIGGEVTDLDLKQVEFNGRLTAKRMDRSSLFAVLAAGQALTQANIQGDQLGDPFAVVIGSGLSGIETLQHQTERFLKRGAGAVSPLTIPVLMPNAPAANISLAYGITGPSYTISSACSSSGHALIDAYEMLKSGRAEIVIAGGTEASITNLGIAAFTKMRAMKTNYNNRPAAAIRPFSQDREGLVMSEGAAMLVLESEASLEKRGIAPLAEMTGYGSTMDAHHLVQPDPLGKGAAKAIRQALQSAGWSPGDIAEKTYVSAHGTGTPANDLMETLSLKEAFGQSAYQLAISSTKSMTGHMIGATGALEMVACVQTMREGIIPPTLNYEHPDPECDLDYVPNVARHKEIQYTLNNSFAFGGHNVCLAMQKV